MRRVIRLVGDLPIRVRVAMALAVAVLPFMIVLLLAYLWIYVPLQAGLNELSHDVEVRFDSVARLQVALTRATMPVNDFLIHGHDSERREYQLAGARVEAAFVLMRNALVESHADEREKVSQLYERWKTAHDQGAVIFKLDQVGRRTPQAAMAMEDLDAAVDGIVDEMDKLLDHVRADLQHSRLALEERRQRMTWFITLSILIAAIVTLVTVVYLGQLIPRHHVSERDEDEDGDGGEGENPDGPKARDPKGAERNRPQGKDAG
jgi:CHASE3 domain sensor protein